MDSLYPIPIASSALSLGILITTIILLRRSYMSICIDSKGYSYLVFGRVQSSELICFNNFDELRGYVRAKGLAYDEEQLNRCAILLLAYKKTLLTIAMLASMIILFQVILLIIPYLT